MPILATRASQPAPNSPSVEEKPRPAVWRRVLDLHLAFEVEDAVAFEFDAVADEAADDLPTALRGLKCAKRAEGVRVLQSALALEHRGRYQVEAAIAARHAAAASAEETDWPQILAW
jgi:hypothetical protein